MSFSKMSEIIEVSQTKNLPLWKVILEDDVLERKVTEKESFSRMEKMLDAMLEASVPSGHLPETILFSLMYLLIYQIQHRSTIRFCNTSLAHQCV